MTVATMKERIIEALSWSGPKSVDELSEELHVMIPYVRRGIAMLMEEELVVGTPDGKKIMMVSNG